MSGFHGHGPTSNQQRQRYGEQVRKIEIQGEGGEVKTSAIVTHSYLESRISCVVSGTVMVMMMVMVF